MNRTRAFSTFLLAVAVAVAFKLAFTPIVAYAVDSILAYGGGDSDASSYGTNRTAGGGTNRSDGFSGDSSLSQSFFKYDVSRFLYEFPFFECEIMNKCYFNLTWR